MFKRLGFSARTGVGYGKPLLGRRSIRLANSNDAPELGTDGWCDHTDCESEPIERSVRGASTLSFPNESSRIRTPANSPHSHGAVPARFPAICTRGKSHIWSNARGLGIAALALQALAVRHRHRQGAARDRGLC